MVLGTMSLLFGTVRLHATTPLRRQLGSRPGSLGKLCQDKASWYTLEHSASKARDRCYHLQARTGFQKIAFYMISIFDVWLHVKANPFRKGLEASSVGPCFEAHCRLAANPVWPPARCKAAASSAENHELSPPDPFMSLQWPRQPCCRNLVEKKVEHPWQQRLCSGASTHQGTLRMQNGRTALYISMRSAVLERPPSPTVWDTTQSWSGSIAKDSAEHLRCCPVIPKNHWRAVPGHPGRDNAGSQEPAVLGSHPSTIPLAGGCGPPRFRKPKVRVARTAGTVVLYYLDLPSISPGIKVILCPLLTESH